MILGTGTLLTFNADIRTNLDCFSKGYEILERIAVYRDAGPNQGWVLNDSKVGVGGWYCE
jgi:hypothetical protein